jgi:hypothetical protein
MTREDRLRMYQQYPEALAGEVQNMLLLIGSEEERIAHNIAVQRITQLLMIPKPGTEEDLKLQDAAILKRLAKRLAQTIINVANHEVPRMDVATAKIELGKGDKRP